MRVPADFVDVEQESEESNDFDEDDFSSESDDMLLLDESDVEFDGSGKDDEIMADADY